MNQSTNQPEYRRTNGFSSGVAQRAATARKRTNKEADKHADSRKNPLPCGRGSLGRLGKIGKIGNGGFFKMDVKMTSKNISACTPKIYGFWKLSQLFRIVPNRSELFRFVPNCSESFRFVPFCSVSFRFCSESFPRHGESSLRYDLRRVLGWRFGVRWCRILPDTFADTFERGF